MLEKCVYVWVCECERFSIMANDAFNGFIWDTFLSFSFPCKAAALKLDKHYIHM